MKKNCVIMIFLVFFISCEEKETPLTKINHVSLKSTLINYFPEIIIEGGFSDENCDFSETSMNPTGEPVGGGANYSLIVNRAEVDFYVENINELIDAIENADSSDFIYLSDNSEFDLTNYSTINITKSITLASGRGNTNGALIKNSKDELGSALFSINETSHVRITGIRFMGPHQYIGTEKKWSKAIDITEASNITIDNCEIFNFSFAGIKVNSSDNIYVHHNNIHNCQGTGLGYGVVLYKDSEVLIEANIFNTNRHDIAGSGDSGQSYEACYNLIEKNSNQPTAHSFDMHCTDESNHACKCPYDIGGKIIIIHHNLFLDDSNYGVYVRGNPETGCWIQFNYFENCSETKAILKNSHVEKLYSKDNHYKRSGKTDVFMASSGKWLVSEGAKGSWVSYNTSNYTVDDLRFGDFNGQ